MEPTGRHSSYLAPPSARTPRARLDRGVRRGHDRYERLAFRVVVDECDAVHRETRGRLPATRLTRTPSQSPPPPSRRGRSGVRRARPADGCRDVGGGREHGDLGEVEYPRDLYHSSTVRRWFDGYMELLAAAYSHKAGR
ncbi:hypothetical protein E1193_14155 [Micromonospora sp. KC606]|uniref:hypothetical protein n=1 Tax=Micromonospora sp. KC606 TaxID=2530379 RepID=UPI001046E418|nr:hypothetical protein [Micromonospora sp. KC606]TDC81654.1 hypothetical protein E1193_14155 [Micromonospora sp. KC606]